MAQLKNTTISDTGSLNLPVGTTAQRPASPAAGQIRYNTTINDTEYYDGGAWRPISDSNPEATGGTVVDTDIGGVPYRIHLFTNTGNSTFAVARSGEVEYLIVAGGGGGAGTIAGGGGAGGLLTGTTTVTAQAYAITVGSGGLGGFQWNNQTAQFGVSGTNSSAFGLSAVGGGGGGSHSSANGQPTAGQVGGSAGGSGASNTSTAGIAGQGNAGGTGGGNNGGGGGGAGSAGLNHLNAVRAGNGGQGIVSSISGNNQFYAGGGGGGTRAGSGVPGIGGLGGGGNGAVTDITKATTDGTTNTGGGGGGGGHNGSSSGAIRVGGAGGSGIVVIRYRRNASTTTQPNQTRPSFLPFFYARDVRPIIARDGLVLDLDAANPLSYPGTSTTWTDLSGSSNNGQLVGGVMHSLQDYGRFIFNGSSGYIDLTGNSTWTTTFNQTTSSIGNNFSISCTINPSAIGTDQALVSQRHGDRMSLWLMENGRVTFEMDDTQNYVGTNTVLQNNRWYTITIVFYNNAANSFVEYYVNGVFERQETKWDGNGSPGITDLWIGWQSRNNYGRNPGFFNGSISNVLIYQRALSRQEVFQNFMALRGRYGI